MQVSRHSPGDDGGGADGGERLPTASATQHAMRFGGVWRAAGVQKGGETGFLRTASTFLLRYSPATFEQMYALEQQARPPNPCSAAPQNVLTLLLSGKSSMCDPDPLRWFAPRGPAESPGPGRSTPAATMTEAIRGESDQMVSSPLVAADCGTDSVVSPAASSFLRPMRAAKSAKSGMRMAVARP